MLNLQEQTHMHSQQIFKETNPEKLKLTLTLLLTTFIKYHKNPHQSWKLGNLLN